MKEVEGVLGLHHLKEISTGPWRCTHQVHMSAQLLQNKQFPLFDTLPGSEHWLLLFQTIMLCFLALVSVFESQSLNKAMELNTMMTTSCQYF